MACRLHISGGGDDENATATHSHAAHHQESPRRGAAGFRHSQSDSPQLRRHVSPQNQNNFCSTHCLSCFELSESGRADQNLCRPPSGSQSSARSSAKRYKKLKSSLPLLIRVALIWVDATFYYRGSRRPLQQQSYWSLPLNAASRLRFTSIL